MINNLRNLFPINIKTIFIIVFLLLLYFGPVKSNDIIADLFVISFGCLISIIGILVISTNSFIQRNIKLRIDADKSNLYYSNSPITFKLIVENIRLLPFLKLKVFLSFKNSNFTSSKYILNNLNKKPFNILTKISFPHRGNWEISHINYELSDQFELFTKRGIYKLNKICDFNIDVESYSLGNFPIIASLEKEGDDFESNDYPQGDPLDLKAYHPSDGLKKIAWKIYARNQTLISRHPERAMSPEGTIAIIALSSKNDSAARLALNYIQKAKQSEMLINFNCLGIKDKKLTHTYNDSKKLLIDTVWESDFLEKNLEICLNSHIAFAKEKQLRQIILTIADFDCIKNSELLINFIEAIKNINVTPILFIAESQKIKSEDVAKIFEIQTRVDIALHTEGNYYEG